MKRSDGFSIVEILVSMVILSIVMLVLTNVTMVSTIGHASARTKDDAQQFAREQLQILLDPSAMVATGSEVKQHKGIDYNISWTVSNEQPPLVTVTASYQKDGKRHSAEVAGYVDSDNVCPDNSSDNKPNAITYYDSEGTIVASPFVVGNSPSNTFVARLAGQDSDAGDIVTVSIKPGEANSSIFRISNDTLYTNALMDDLNSTKPLKLIATDCAGNTEVFTATIQIGGVSEKPEVDSPFDAGNVTENAQSGTLGMLVPNASDPGGDPIVWTTTDANFNVDASSGLITVASTANIDYESTAGTYSFTVKATRNAEYTNVTVNVTVANINENPTIQAAPVTFSVPEDAATGNLVGTILFNDPDGNSAPNNWGLVKTYQFGISPDFNVDEAGNITIKEGASIAQGVTETMTIYAEDGGNLQSEHRGVTINISAPTNTGGTGGETIPQFDANLWSTYEIGTKVLFNGATWECVKLANRNWDPGSTYAEGAWACIANCP